MKAQVQVDQLGDVVDHLLGVLQGPHPLTDHLGADHLVVMKTHPAVGLVAARCRLADVMQQRRPAQHEIGTGVLQGDRLPQHGQGMLVDVLVLVMFVDGHPHPADLGQHHLTEPCPHHQLDACHRVGAEQHLVQFDCDPLDGDPGQLRCHRYDGLLHPVGYPEPQLRDEPGGTQHPQRIVTEGHGGFGRGVQNAVADRRQPAQRVLELPRAGSGDPHRHRVGGEVAAHQILGEAVAETHLGIARHLVVAVGPEGGDLQPMPGLGRPDGAEVDPGVPHRVGPRPDDVLHLLRAGVSGEVEVGGQPTQHGVAHTAADEVQLTAGEGEPPADLTKQVVVPIELDGGSRQQLGVIGGVGHVR